MKKIIHKEVINMKEKEFKEEFIKKLKQVTDKYLILEEHIDSLFIPIKKSNLDYSINSIHRLSEELHNTIKDLEIFYNNNEDQISKIRASKNHSFQYKVCRDCGEEIADNEQDKLYEFETQPICEKCIEKTK